MTNEKLMPLLTAKEAAAWLKVDRHTLTELPLPYVMLGKRKRRYREEDLEAFVKTRLRYEHTLPPPEPRHYTYRPYSGPISHLPTWEEARAMAAGQKLGQEPKRLDPRATGPAKSKKPLA